MRYLNRIWIAGLLAFISTSLLAEGKTATTLEGRTVVLHANGSWHYTSDANMDDDTNLGGSDYRSFDLPWPDPGICADTCDEEEQCKAWTFVQSGYQGNKARCWLKRAVPRSDSNACCISGIKREATDDDDYDQRFGSDAGVVLQAGTGLSMEETLASLGRPDNFSKMLLMSEEGDGRQPIAIEIWDYSDGNRAYIFVDGQPQGIAELPPSKGSRCRPIQHDPQSLQLGMSITDAGKLFGADLTTQLFSDADLNVYEIVAIDGVVLGFDKERLVYAETCVEDATGEVR